MFQVIFSQDTDITPKEARDAQKISIGPVGGGQGAMTIGVEPCAEIVVGFIWPCGTLRVGGCVERTFSGETAIISRLLQQGGDTTTEVTLDPEKDMETIQKAIFLGRKKRDRQ
jgi:hypothetical protein